MAPYNLTATKVPSGDKLTLSGPPILVRPGGSEVILTSGSDLNQAAQGAWPSIINGAIKFFNAFRANNLVPNVTRTSNANYGSKSSQANYSFRGREFDGIGNMPGPTPAANRPTYNNLVPIVWGLRDLDLKAQASSADLLQWQVIQVGPSTFEPAGTATLQETLL